MSETSWRITRGSKTNRVRKIRVLRKSDPQVQRALRRYRQDPLVRGLDQVTTTISLPVQDLARIDAACNYHQIARSFFLRQAATLAIAALNEDSDAAIIAVVRGMARPTE